MGIEALIDGKQEVPADPPEPVTAAEPVIETPVIEEPQAPEPPANEPPAAEPEGKETVPLPVFLQVRDEVKELTRKVRDYEAANAPRPAEPAEMPDPIDDPAGFANWQQGQVTQALVAQRFQTSDIIAKQQHGEETVEAAALWATEKAKANPAFAQEYMQQPHPIDWIVRQHKRDGLLTQIGDDEEAFVRRRAAELGLTAPTAGEVQTPPAQQQQVAAPVMPPQSLAGARSTGGAVKDIPIGGLAALETVFQR